MTGFGTLLLCSRAAPLPARRGPLTLHSLILIYPLRLINQGVRCLREPARRLAVAVGALIAPLAAAAVEAQRIAMGSRCCAVHTAHHLRVQAPAQRRATAKMAQAQNRGQLEPAVVPLLARHDGQVPFLP